MDKNYKEMISANYMMFTELLRPKSVPLIRYLYDEQVIEGKKAKKTMSQAASTLRVMHLLDNLLELEQDQFNLLYSAMLYAKAWRAADTMEPTRRPHEKTYGTRKKLEIPDKWPDDDYFKKLEEEGLKIEPVQPKDSRMIECYEKPTKYNVYEMKAKINGRVLIINNNKFEHQDQKATRLGSEKDVEYLDKLFTGLGFETVIEEDLTCDDMWKLLKAECKKDHADYGCFFLIIMSHGMKGVVFGADFCEENGSFKNVLKIEDIKQMFYTAKGLERKPKVFIIQACQGDDGSEEQKPDEKDQREENKEDPTGEPTQHGGGELENENQPSNVESQAPNAENQPHQPPNDENQPHNDESQPPNDETQAANGESHADDSSDTLSREDDENTLTTEKPFHFVVAMSTTEGNYSKRHFKNGAWFIQAIILVFSKYANQEDLMTLMENVNDLVRKAGDSNFRQITEMRDQTFTKKLYFFPGLPLETKPEAKKPFSSNPVLSSALKTDMKDLRGLHEMFQ